MGDSSRSLWVAVLPLLLVISTVTSLVGAQGLPQSPYSAPDVLRREAAGLDMSASRPLAMPGTTGGLPRGSDSILVTPQLFQGIVPAIPNLQVGYLLHFGESVNGGRLTLDYLLPLTLGNDLAFFGEIHNQWQDFWKTVTRGANNRVDLSIGGGIRKIFGKSTLVGVNGFFDGARLGGKWYNSGSVGFEYAALLPGNDAIDMTFNWYGNLFNSSVLANAFRRGPSNYDFQAGYSHELWNGGPDLRLYATGYRFSAGSAVYGGRGGAELKTRDGMFVVKYEAADDRVNKTYHTIGGFVNVGFQLSRLLNGESPFTMPEPIFESPRRLTRWLTRLANRTYAPPTSVVTARALGECEGVTFILRNAGFGMVLVLKGANTPFTSIIGDPTTLSPTSGTYTLTWSGVNVSAGNPGLALYATGKGSSASRWRALGASSGTYASSETGFWTRGGVSRYWDALLVIDRASLGHLVLPPGATITITVCTP